MLQGNRVLKVNEARLGRQGHLVIQETQVLEENQVFRVHQGSLEKQELPGKRGLREIKDSQVSPDQPVSYYLYCKLFFLFV